MERKKLALISVSDKRGLVEFAQIIQNSGFQILSTGGTARILRDHQIQVTDVSNHTGFPEIMDGRVKTLHPKIHCGLLGRRGQDESTMAEHGIDAIDLLVVNLYPFAETVAQPGCQLTDAIENIDIGGPAMIRAGAKNFTSVAVVVDPDDYAEIGSSLEQGGVSDEQRYRLAAKAYGHTAAYDGMVSNYLMTREQPQDFPASLNLSLEKHQDLRYGENPHQQAAFYRSRDAKPGSLAHAAQLQGKPLSYNNIADSDAALQCVRQFEAPACVIVKHANPCGVAIGESILGAYQRAFKTDPTSAFGGIIAFNRNLDSETARQIVGNQFVEVILAPAVSETALQELSAKKNIRVLKTGDDYDSSNVRELKQVDGGYLIQDRDDACVQASGLKVVSQLEPSQDQIQDMLFAWQVAKYVKSNAIVFAKDQMTIGVGAGQMSRVYSTKIAAIKAADENLTVSGSVMASDAFFPFRDGIDTAAEFGISAIIQPGGSIRDDEVIQAANDHGMAMVFTGERHFRH